MQFFFTEKNLCWKVKPIIKVLMRLQVHFLPFLTGEKWGRKSTWKCGKYFWKKKKGLIWETCLILLKNDYPKKTSIEHLASVLQLVHFCIDIHILFPTKKRKGGGEGQPKNNEKKSWKIFSTKLLLSRERKINSFTSFFSWLLLCPRPQGSFSAPAKASFKRCSKMLRDTSL